MRNTKIILIVVAIVTLLLGLVFVVLGDDDPIATNKALHSNPASDPDTAAPVETSEQVNPLGYQDYDAEVVAQTEGKKILFFHATWCPTCRALDQNIKAGVVPANLTIFKVNFDTENDLKKKHGVTYQHTLVQVGDNGEQLSKWFGSYTIDQLADEAV